MTPDRPHRRSASLGIRSRTLAVRSWLTGFTGSTARLCVTQGAAALLVDSRYWEQAEGELDGAPFEVVRLGAPDAPSQEAWLSQHLTRGRVGLAPELWSESDVRRIRTSLADCGLELALVPDLFDDVWTQGRPAVRRPPSPR